MSSTSESGSALTGAFLTWDKDAGRLNRVFSRKKGL